MMMFADQRMSFSRSRRIGFVVLFLLLVTVSRRPWQPPRRIGSPKQTVTVAPRITPATKQPSKADDALSRPAVGLSTSESFADQPSPTASPVQTVQQPIGTSEKPPTYPALDERPARHAADLP
jgi:hypothetical protein